MMTNVEENEGRFGSHASANPSFVSLPSLTVIFKQGAACILDYILPPAHFLSRSLKVIKNIAFKYRPSTIW
jgi:hypothetical protein